MKWLIVIVGIACNAAASVLVKVAVMPPRNALLFKQPLSILANVPLVAGLVLYGASFVLYAAALTMLPLNVAYPVLTSGAIATVATVSVLVFGEPMPWTTIVGILLVMIGVIFIAARVA